MDTHVHHVLRNRPDVADEWSDIAFNPCWRRTKRPGRRKATLRMNAPSRLLNTSERSFRKGHRTFRIRPAPMRGWIPLGSAAKKAIRHAPRAEPADAKWSQDSLIRPSGHDWLFGRDATGCGTGKTKAPAGLSFPAAVWSDVLRAGCTGRRLCFRCSGRWRPMTGDPRANARDHHDDRGRCVGVPCSLFCIHVVPHAGAGCST